VFHILDSLPNNSFKAVEGKRLQNILLKHFKDEKFMDGRITTNLAQVISHLNTSDIHSRYEAGPSPK